MGTPLTEFLIAVCFAELGFLIFYLSRKHRFKEFTDSHTILLIIMTVFITVIPVLSQYKDYAYFIFPAYLFAINMWLFLTKNIVFKSNWQDETDAKKAVRRTYLILALGSIEVLILLIKGVPHTITQ